VAGLLAPYQSSNPVHLLRDEAVAHLGTVELKAHLLQVNLKPYVTHDRSDYLLAPVAVVDGKKADELEAKRAELKKKIDRALNRAGITPDSRKFFPHVTLARVARTPIGRTARFLAEHSGFALPPFEVTSFLLFSSRLTPDGAIHRPEAEFLLNE